MYTKLAFVQGVQSSLVESGFLAYGTAEEAADHATKLASCLTVDPAEVDFGPSEVAEIADTLMSLKTAGAADATEDTQALNRLEAALGNIKRAMNEGGDLAAAGAAGATPDTNATADYDTSGNGDTSTPIGSGSTTGDEKATPPADSVADRQAPEGVDGAGADTNAKAKYQVAGNGDSSVAERQTTGDELKVAAAWGAHLDSAVEDNVKVATVRELARLASDAERQCLVDYVNDNFSRKTAATDNDILAAIASAAN